jgi:hypothetical protein
MASDIEAGPKIVLGHGRTILYGNGKISLVNTFNQDGTLAGTGCIALAGYELTASTVDASAQTL